MNRYARGVSLGIPLALLALVSACAAPQAAGGRGAYSRMPPWSYVGTPLSPFWWHTTTKIGEMHAHGKDGKGRTVAVLDSGFLKGHEDVANVDPLGVELCSNRPTNDFDDFNGHGTALAGITLGRDKGAGIATAGAAPQATLLPIKVVCGVSNAERVRQGVLVAIGKKADVVLLALGPWPSDRDSGGKKVHDRLLEMVPAHPEILFVVASVWDDSRYLRPEWTKAGNVVLAAAMTLDNAGTEIVYSEKSGDIWAPGRDVETASIDDADRRQHAPFLMQGTSAAAAIVAGCAAAIKADAESGTSLKTRLGKDFMVPMPNGKGRLDCSRGLP